ncbi:hypothetical protein GCM10025875_31120 [Litorihabitans aurantiacus]|uniref:Uncharacterized protein n=1 Tax=Litorihabitans aurantiacus TaxID=1930061 RepID=A0AA37XGQ5_9MICO|nr:hypothetical protein GCM10025875_31120 [Litorihabitans aurantiacus]
MVVTEGQLLHLVVEVMPQLHESGRPHLAVLDLTVLGAAG